MCKPQCGHLFAARSQVSRLPRALAISCSIVLLLILTPRISFAQSRPNSSPTSTNPTLSQLKDLSTQLVQRLTERIAESQTLSDELIALKDRAEKLQTDLWETSTSLDKLKTDLENLQNDFDAYKINHDIDIDNLKKERDAALVKARIGKLGFTISISVVVIAGVYEGGRALKLW
jgi:hypothetical protein